MEEGDVHHSLPRAGSQFPSNSITDFTLDRLLREPLSSSWLIYPHPSHPFRACLSPTCPLRLSLTTRPDDLALLRCLCPVAPVQASVHAWLFTGECKQTHKDCGSASLAASLQEHCPALCAK